MNSLYLIKREGSDKCYRKEFPIKGIRNTVTLNSDFAKISTALGNL